MKILLETIENVVEDKKGYVVLVSMQEDGSNDFEEVFSYQSGKHSSPINATKYVMANMTELINKGLEDGKN